ncbi:CspA family cold shock protein [Mumia flava]|uniref:CspA family cold shock protein n=1 Tax=Mumia flava TaxID=1348852 RepID=A0A0B2B3Y9_9ACTN|nr:cold-shock protein [Mumia flava]PJJ56975.1 CspA family cold shock protein [Mumia flava]
MPVGKVKWYDSDKGFGFLSRDDGEDVYVRADALPSGLTNLKPGTRVEFGIVAGRRGDQALQVRVLEKQPSVAQQQARARRKRPEDMVVIVEDLIGLLDQVEGTYRAGRHPEGKTAKQTAALLRALADQLSA